MEEPLNNSKRGGIARVFMFSRMDLAVLPFIFAGLGAAFISSMGAMALGYDSRPRDFRAIIFYASLFLLFPTFLIALLQRRWASLPLWMCTLVILAPAFVHMNSMFAESSIKGELELLGVALLTQVARLIRGNHPEKRT